MGATAFGTELERLARNTTAAGMDRARAIYELQRHGLPPSADFLKALVTDRDVNVRAAVVYVAGIHTTDGAKAVAAAALRDSEAMVQRRAAEAIVRQGLTPGRPSFAPDRRHLRVAPQPRSLRAVLGPRRARTHATP